MDKPTKSSNLFKLALGLVQGQRTGQGLQDQELDMLKMVKCPVCTEIPFPPIYMCSFGHNICKSCKPELQDCPTCKGDLTENRNYTVENIVLASKHSCPLKIDGCTVQITGEFMEAHIQNCQYRSFVCPSFGWENCGMDSLRLPKTRDHFIDTHDVKPWTGPNVLLRRNVPVPFESVESAGNPCLQSPTVLMDYDGKEFLIHTFTSNGCIFWMVMLIGAEEQAKKYRAKIISQQGRETEIQWTVPVISITQGAELAKNGNNSKVFVPSCPIQHFKEDWDKSNSYYIFYTSYTIIKK